VSGHDKAEPRSAWEVKRKIRLSAAPMHSAETGDIERILREIDGVLQVSAEGTRRAILVRYLVTKTDYQSLERTLEATGFPPANSRWERFKSNWYQNLDLTGRENAGARPSPCCSKPPRA